MTIHGSTAPFHATITRLPGSGVGLLTLTRAIAATPAAPSAPQNCSRAEEACQAHTQRRIFNVIFDNSGSMGQSTEEGLRSIIRPLLRLGWFHACLVTLFDEDTVSYRIPDEAALDDLLANLPRQRQTNIAKGVNDGMAFLGPGFGRDG